MIDREVDSRGNCRKCGGIHYGSYMCPMPDEQIEEIKMHDQQAASAEMPRYKCHKEVWALKIKEIKLAITGGYTVVPEESGYVPFWVSNEWVHKHNPQIGGYYVAYKDGYKSFSPAQAFEEGYTRV
jgi:hypothetical protein